MTIKYLKNIPLSTISTFKLGGIAKEVAVLENENDVVEFFEKIEPGKKWMILGGGSNVVFSDADCDVSILQYTSDKVQIKNNDNEKFEVVADAGLNWDSFVEFTVKNDLSGIETLSAIPGTVGATPIQNVGAYGTEIKDTLLCIRVYDSLEKKFLKLENVDCKFGYRDSIFKGEARGRYVITQVAFLLSKEIPKIPKYQGVSEYFKEKNITNPSLLDIRNAIIEIRAGKLPNPKSIASVGSFFKNPIVSKSKGEELKKKFPTLAVFPVDENNTKIGAGSMIDTLGWKGKKIGNFSFYKGNAMVVVHEGGGNRAELIGLIENLNNELDKKYGIKLEPEPELIDF